MSRFSFRSTCHPWQLRTGLSDGADRRVELLAAPRCLAQDRGRPDPSEDPRPSIAGRYGDKPAFLSCVDDAISSLVGRRLMLPAESAAAKNRMSQVWSWLVRNSRDSRRAGFYRESRAGNP